MDSVFSSQHFLFIILQFKYTISSLLFLFIYAQTFIFHCYDADKHLWNQLYN